MFLIPVVVLAACFFLFFLKEVTDFFLVFNYADLWPLTPTMLFPPHNCLSEELSYFEHRSSKNPRDGCDVVKIPGDQQFLKHTHAHTLAARLAPTTIFITFKVTSVPFLLHPDAHFEIQRVVFTASWFLIAPSCCNVISFSALCPLEWPLRMFLMNYPMYLASRPVQLYLLRKVCFFSSSNSTPIAVFNTNNTR